MTARHPYFDAPGGFAALAHRGFNRDGLENSMAAFQAAVDMGYRYLETDAHGTADGVAVALHDETLDRTTDGAGRVADLPWRDVRKARIGGVEPVPGFEDLLGTWPDVRINVDVKGESGIEPVARAIERTRAHDRVCIASFSTARRMATVKLLSRPVATSAGTGEVAAFLRRAAFHRDGSPALEHVDAIQIPAMTGKRATLPRWVVDAAHRAGRIVHVWTVNERAAMEALIDRGVDGIVTDRADLLLEVLAGRGMTP